MTFDELTGLDAFETGHASRHRFFAAHAWFGTKLEAFLDGKVKRDVSAPGAAVCMRSSYANRRIKSGQETGISCQRPAPPPYAGRAGYRSGNDVVGELKI